ncbi:Integral membrane protein [Colletotrichum higginsianum IMI 349063]|uniref:Integral membrane protein n=1 Tax=Colletotrichum higginsianum (strain IMI 349063) TaxID=759273 RepID=A0A1B7YET4_COLHI|nr:Integral membrane protein [Colletotrichum higginsianum IMI 349063]OBR10440.1 Integral membrane protein [Colletotrichum higginsianum IMI 349063]
METGTETAPTAPTGAPAPAFNTEPAAVFWLVWAGVWTATVLCGMAFLFVNRHMPFLRIRGLALSFGAVTMLHLYWMSVQIGLSVGQFVPDGAEFWVMGLYLPFGIALFHASNSRFLHVAKAQRRYADKPPPPCGACLPPSLSLSPSPSPSPSSSKPLHSPAAACSCGLRDSRSLAARFRRLDYTTKMLTVVCTGMVVQVLLTVAMYLASRKYHPWFGIPGTEVKGTPTQQKVEMGRGWEWWPSVLWQFVWAWMVAPVILCKSRGIRDTQGWRLQTIACCLASLHATPMWLVALYVPEMAPVNRYFIPPQWICLSILFIEIFAIFIPCWQVVRHKSLQQETLESIAVWEAKNRNRNDDDGGGHGSDSFITDSTKVGSRASVVWQSLVELEKNTSQADSVYTMSALEYVLDKNPEPLRKFSALRDFSGENIAFLSAVGEWKASIPQGPGVGRQRSPELARDRFNRALRIYTEFVSPYHAEFQINIASQDLKRLQGVFDHAARIMYGGRTERFTDPVVPFEDAMWSPAAAAAEEGSDQEETGGAASAAMLRWNGSADPIADRVQYWGEIPEAFNAAVFDDAEASIKYLVLTNTWPKFVKERRTSLGSEDSGETAETDHSASTSTSTSALSRVARYFRGIKAAT